MQLEVREIINARRRERYAANPEKARIRTRVYYHAHKKEYNAKSLAYYYAHKERLREYNKAYYSIRKLKYADQHKAYYAVHKEKIKTKKIEDRYKLGPGGFEELFNKQGKVCAICHDNNWGRRRPLVDHDHGNGKVRGILCTRCNLVLGLIHDDPIFAQSIISYLSSNLACDVNEKIKKEGEGK